MRSLTVSVIIPHKDDLRGLVRTLSALTGQVVDKTWFEVIVVDNRSIDGITKIAELAGMFDTLNVRIVEESVIGAGPARNCGAATARAPILAFLDCDCCPAPNWLRIVEEMLQSQLIIGGPVRVETDLDAAHLTPAAAFDLLYGFNVSRSFTRHGLLLTANMAVHKKVFEQVGPFRNGLSEDRDWCERARRLGLQPMLSEDLTVRHTAVEDQSKLENRWMRVTRESFAFYREYGRSNLDWALYCLLTLCSPILHGIRIFTDERLSKVSFPFRLKLLRTLARIRFKRGLLGLCLLFSG